MNLYVISLEDIKVHTLTVKAKNREEAKKVVEALPRKINEVMVLPAQIVHWELTYSHYGIDEIIEED